MTKNERPTNAIPEVEAFLTAAEELQTFRKDNPEFFEELDTLLSNYNTTFDAADKAVRARQVSCGPFQLTGNPTVSYDADLLLEEMGQTFFLAHGGSVVQRTVYAVDRARVEAAYAAGLIPKEVSDRVRKIKLAYHKPVKAVLP